MAFQSSFKLMIPRCTHCQAEATLKYGLVFPKIQKKNGVLQSYFALEQKESFVMNVLLLVHWTSQMLFV